MNVVDSVAGTVVRFLPKEYSKNGDSGRQGPRAHSSDYPDERMIILLDVQADKYELKMSP